MSGGGGGWGAVRHSGTNRPCRHIARGVNLSCSSLPFLSPLAPLTFLLPPPPPRFIPLSFEQSERSCCCCCCWWRGGGCGGERACQERSEMCVCVCVCVYSWGRGRYDEASVLSRWISWMTLRGLFSCLWAHSQLTVLSSSPSPSLPPNLHVSLSISVSVLFCFFIGYLINAHTPAPKHLFSYFGITKIDWFIYGKRGLHFHKFIFWFVFLTFYTLCPHPSISHPKL